MVANINVTERNTLPVLYNINSSTITSLQHEHYIYIRIYIYIIIYIYIYTLLSWQPRNINHIYKLKEGSSWQDCDITGIKKPLIVLGALKSCYITPDYGRCEDNNVGVNKLTLLQT